jgi:hypothetical protein
VNAAVLKGLLALAAACIFLSVAVALFMTRRDLASVSLALGIGSFGIMALTHVFESFSILPSFGWGQSHSVGHMIDLAAALLGVTFVGIRFLLRRRVAPSKTSLEGSVNGWAAFISADSSTLRAAFSFASSRDRPRRGCVGSRTRRGLSVNARPPRAPLECVHRGATQPRLLWCRIISWASDDVSPIHVAAARHRFAF